jgi:hypothetical protein
LRKQLIEFWPAYSFYRSMVRFCSVRLGSIRPRSGHSTIHLDAAVTLRDQDRIAAVLTFDRQLQNACRRQGLAVEAPAAAEQ